jgi:hypothetical protein
MNFNGLDHLNYTIGLYALAIMFVTVILILLGLKFRNLGYKAVVFVLSLGTLVLTYFCFRHEVNFPITGSLFLIESILGFGLFSCGNSGYF